MEHGQSTRTKLVGIEHIPEGPRTTLVFWIIGSEKTISHSFMLAGTNPLASLRIWTESLHRQLDNDYTSPESQVPDLKKLIYVDGLTEKQANEKVKAIKDSLNLQAHYLAELDSLKGEEFTLWFKVTQTSDQTYYDYVPYVVRTQDATTATTALPINTK